MSEALDWLVQARPDALGPYFAFLKACGTQLDPKTRALISVITKVDAQTERGLRQYLKRALAAGCTPAEVVDALLMAFPTLGLAKIVWAVDVILAMELPGFAPEALAADAAGRWHELGAADAPEPGTARRVVADGRALFVVRLADGGHRVWDARCPHQGTEMPEAALDGATLACPQHGWRFDLASGAALGPGDRPLTERPHRVDGGRLLARW